MKGLIVLFLGIVLCTVNIAVAQESLHTITVENAYAYSTVKVQKNGAIFMTIRNTMPIPDRVIAAYSEVADRVELHTHIMDGDIMMMRQVDGYDIPGGSTVTLEPMGHHIMLMGLKDPLQSGTKFRLTLDFEKADDMTINVNVQ